SVDIRTFEFNSFVNNGTYNTLSAGSPNSGTVTVTGSTNAAPEPVSAALTGLGMLALISRRTVMSRHRRLRIRSVDTGQQISGQP
ncbi:MAG TPA: hypothetical protein VG672_26685, partial [Bryobacteraceae bacterium]|nr:hypothetical protein [Bryobacteraceae bacterium]